MELGEVLAERIIQLDNLYSIARDLRFKALILSQMLHLAKAIEPNFLNDEKLTISTYDGHEKEEFTDIRIAEAILRLAYAHEKAYYNEKAYTVPITLARIVTLMDRIRTKILTMLIENGFIRHFKEIPIAIADKEVDSYE